MAIMADMDGKHTLLDGVLPRLGVKGFDLKRTGVIRRRLN
jgi:hypothetical protein